MSEPGPAEPLQLGAFELLAPIASGGSGEVWHGRHRATDLEVAVKVLHAERARRLEVRKSFREEVRATARLDHPGIVVVYEHGEIPRSVHAASEGRLVSRSPYLVMEYCEHGSLEDMPPTRWPQVRRVLLALLHALSHAHSRGVVHRDVKPGNVLLAEDDFQRLILTDFGIASAVTRQDSPGGEAVAGTPAYMAPEQALGRWRDFGPWTDLYALGTMAWELTTGRVPFHGLKGPALLQAHVGRELPEYTPRLPVPEHFDNWLERCLEKEHLRRYSNAADAAWALMNLRDPDEDGEIEAVLSSGRSAAEFRTWSMELSGDTGQVDSPTSATETWGFADELPEDDEPTEMRMTSLPPMPDSWRMASSKHTPARLRGAGLGLYGLRAVPLVGREQERDFLWGELGEVRKTRRPRLVLLRGGAGNGKSRLAQWLCERSVELGAAHAMTAVHGDVRGPRHGLSPMVAAYFRTTELAFKQVSSRAKRWFRAHRVDEPWEWDDVARLVAPKPDLPGGFFESAKEGHEVVRRLMQRVGRDRPVVVWLDDAQWGADTLAFVVQALQRAEVLPVLFIASVRDDLLPDRPVELQMLRWLSKRSEVKDIEIGPLTRDDHIELVQVLAGLDRRLVEQVVDRTGGNPLFAVQLVGDWVQRGVLEPGDKGFVLAEGSEVPLPDDIHGLWRSRTRTAVWEAGGGEAQLETLWLGAALGLDVDLEEWKAAARLAEREPSDELLQHLERRQLLATGPDGWRFAHGMMRESLIRSAKEALAWERCNTTCARMLMNRYGAAAPAARVAQHLLLANAPADAIGPLLAAAENDHRMARFQAARTHLEQRERCLDEIDAPANSPDRHEGWVMACRLHLALGEYDAAMRLAERLRGSSPPPRLRAEAYFVIGEAARRRGKLELAKRRLTEARSLFAGAHVPDREAAALRAQAELERAGGDLDRAAELAREALALAEGLGQDGAIATTLQLLGGVYVQTGDLDTAETCFRKARKLQERNSLRRDLMNTINGLAEIARKRGQLDVAEKGYMKAIAEAERIGAEEASYISLNRAMVLVERGEYDAARHVLDRAGQRLAASRRDPLTAFAHALALVPCAGLNLWDDFAYHQAATEQLLERTTFADADLARALESAGDMARIKGREDECRSVWAAAERQWERLGDEAGLARVRHKAAGGDAPP